MTDCYCRWCGSKNVKSHHCSGKNAYMKGFNDGADFAVIMSTCKIEEKEFMRTEEKIVNEEAI